MDLITTALVSALATGLVSGVTKIGESLIGDAYQALKTAISKKFGKKNKVVQAVKELESDPRSVRAQEALSRSMREAGADRDRELLQLAEHLIQTVININQSAGDHAIQIGQGNTISGVVAQKIEGNVYNVTRGPTAPTAQDLLIRGVELVRARSYGEAGTLLSQSLLATPSGDGNYYLALALLQGKRPRVLTYSQAVSIRAKLTSACALDSTKSCYWYFLALLEEDFFIDNGFSDDLDKVEDLVHTGDRCRFVRSFLAELLDHAPARGSEVYEYLLDKL